METSNYHKWAILESLTPLIVNGIQDVGCDIKYRLKQEIPTSIVTSQFRQYYVKMFERTGPDSDVFEPLSAPYCDNQTLCTLQEFERYGGTSDRGPSDKGPSDPFKGHFRSTSTVVGPLNLGTFCPTP